LTEEVVTIEDHRHAGSGGAARAGTDRPSYYVTTPIYYPSGRLHIGHAYTTVAADFVVRYKRLCGYDARLLTGTDEHSQKIERAARKEGLGPQEFVDRAFEEITRLWDVLDISYDDFIRTTEPRHKRAVQEMFSIAFRQGDIYKGAYEGWYCTECESFFLERQLAGGKCPDCGRPVEWLTEEAYFFRLSRYQDRLLRHIEEHPEFIQPVSRRNEMVSFINSGLQDLCVTRSSFTWGIKVPFDPKHVIYVWFDALSNYITAINYGRNDGFFERYWPADVHLVGKEIVRFHSIIWPIILMSMGLPLPRQVFGHGWLVLEGEKISKSKGNVIDPVILVEKYGLDPVRYFLLRELPFGADGNYSEEALVRRSNTELANDLGNLLSRTVAMVERFTGGKVPVPDDTAGDGRPLREAAATAFRQYTEHFAALELADAIGAVLGLVGRANKYIEDKSPWDLAKDPSKEKELGNVLYDLLETLRLSAVLLSPALTRAPGEILRQLGFADGLAGAKLPEAATFGLLPPGRRVRRGAPLFPRIEFEETPFEGPTGGGPAAGKGPAGQLSTGGCPGARPETAAPSTAPVATAAPAAPEAPPAAPAAPEAPPATPGAAQAPGDRLAFEDFQRVDLRVARVLEAARVPRTDKLLRLRIRIGGSERWIVAGIAAHYSPEQVAGKDIVVVANLEPATIRGERSEGMLLAAVHGDEMALVVPERDVPVGAKVR